jgi:bifunctional DNase/RNase
MEVVMIPVELMGLQVEPDTGAPIVLLRETDDPHRLLPVFIGTPEAIAIAVGIEGAMASRPLTHDLLIDVLEGADTRLERVDVTALEEGTFHAELHLRGPDGVRQVSSRPSDAIALAVRLGAPMFASEAVLDEAGLEVVDVEETTAPRLSDGEIEAEVEQFTSFLDEIDPADFEDSP